MKTVLGMALLLTGCAYNPEVIVLFGPKRIENQVDPGVSVSLIQRFGKHGACGYIHSSDPEHGVPFNNEPEFVLDHAGCGPRWGGQRR